MALTATLQTTSLKQLIDKQTVECLNQDDAHPVTNVLEISDPSMYLASSLDSQILLKFGFHQAARIEKIIIKCAKIDDTEDNDIDSFPQTLKIFTNNMNLGFTEAETLLPLFSASFSKEEVRKSGQAIITVNAIKFRSTKSLALFFDGNFGDVDVTKIGALDVQGRQLESTNMGNWKPVDKDKQWAPSD